MKLLIPLMIPRVFPASLELDRLLFQPLKLLAILGVCDVR